MTGAACISATSLAVKPTRRYCLVPGAWTLGRVLLAAPQFFSSGRAV